MGYRSDIMVIISCEDKVKFQALLKDIKTLEVVEYGEVKDNGVDAIKVTFSYIKWYADTFEDVREFERWLNKIVDEDENGDTAYHFVRIGESIDDIEERINGEPKYWVYINRSLEADF